MQVTTAISLPKSLAKAMEEQIEEGKFTSRSEFIRSAVRTYLLFQKGELSWEILAAPFRAFAQKSNLTEKDILEAVPMGTVPMGTVLRETDVTPQTLHSFLLYPSNSTYFVSFAVGAF